MGARVSDPTLQGRQVLRGSHQIKPTLKPHEGIAVRDGHCGTWDSGGKYGDIMRVAGGELLGSGC